MIIPVRCFTCGKVVANKYEKYIKMVDEKKDKQKIFEELKLKRYCCRRMLLTHVPLIEELKS